MTRGRLRILASVTALGAHPAAAQTMAGWPQSEAGNVAVVEAGFEPELFLSIGYLHSLSSRGPGPRLWAGAGLKAAPLALFRHGAWRLDGLMAADWRAATGFGVAATGAIYTAHDRNDTGELYGLGMEVRAVPGYGGARWQAGLDLGWQGTLLTHVRSSDLVSRTFGDRYPPGAGGIAGPHDGWYGSTAHRFRLGLRAAWAVNDRLAFSLGLGALAAYQRQGVLVSFDLAQIPFYVDSGVRIGW